MNKLKQKSTLNSARNSNSEVQSTSRSLKDLNPKLTTQLYVGPNTSFESDRETLAKKQKETLE